MISTLHVLSIGSQETGALVRDVLVLRSRCRLYVASSTWDISVVFGSEEIDVAILHNTFSSPQLRVFAAYIRRRWPYAKILLIRRKGENTDYCIYDERIAPGVSPKTFLTAIERLGACARRARRPIANSPYNQISKQNDSSQTTFTRAVKRS